MYIEKNLLFSSSQIDLNNFPYLNNNVVFLNSLYNTRSDWTACVVGAYYCIVTE